MKLGRDISFNVKRAAPAPLYILALALSGPALAGDDSPSGAWRLDMSLGARTAELPTFDTPVGDTFAARFPGLLSEAFRPTLFGGEANAIYAPGGGWEVEIGGGYWSGSDSASAQPLPGYGLSVTGLDGNSGTLVGAGFLEGDRVKTSVDASLGEAHLRLARSFDGGGITLRPFAGLLYERSAQDYAASFRLQEPAVNNLEIPYALNQEVDSTRLGGEIGLRVSFPLGQGWQLHTAAAFALYRQDSGMKARDCVAAASFTPGFACQDDTAAQYQRRLDTAASDDDDRLASRVKLEAGLSIPVGPAVLGVNGFAQYDSDVAGVKNPLLSEDQFLGGDPTRPPPAHLVFDEAWTYGGTVSLTIPLD
jgi:hypothetical protein